jgi:UDP-N-acetylglucosamine diphosphorylase/glucosamine-1-phosphate N-acetyltransferase
VRVCIFEGPEVDSLAPLTLTRPAFDLRCGIATLLERQLQYFGATECALWVRPHLAAVCRERFPGAAVNDPGWFGPGPQLLVNARWLPAGEPPAETGPPRVGMCGDQVAYMVLPALTGWKASPSFREELQKRSASGLPKAPAEGIVIQYPWDLVEQNARLLRDDIDWFRGRVGWHARPLQITLAGPEYGLVVAPGARLEPLIFADTTDGPVLIDEGALVHAFSRLQGPCYIGPGAWVVGGKLSGSSLGPQVRIGGEVEASIFQGFANKYHDGFVGHSYIGEWVNLAAGTQVSDLRNDYATVRMRVGGREIDTGLTKIGAFVGDHSKTGLTALLNTGSSVGAFTQLLSAGGLLPRTVPSFCNCNRGQLTERSDLAELFRTAALAMRRRGQELTDAQKDLYSEVFRQTAGERRQALSRAAPERP